MMIASDYSDDDDEYIPLKKRLMIDLTGNDKQENNVKHIDLTMLNSDDDDDDNKKLKKKLKTNKKSITNSTSYALKRKDKSDDRNWILFRPNRKNSKLTIIRDWLQSKRTCRMVTENEAKAFISTCLEKFTITNNSIKNVIIKHQKKQVLIDQDIWNACSYVSICHLTYLKYLNSSILSKQWLKIWNRLSPAGNPFEDIASMLDQLSNIDNTLMYIPIRTSDENENRFNTDLPNTHDMTFETPYDRIKHFFESSLHQGTPIAFNQAQHSRVAIAYNDTDILCIDSFPRLYEETHEYMYMLSGLSIVNKEYVYQWVRDCAIFL